MARIIAVFNNKGGVGKTNICWNLADTLARRGKFVLLIDFDPQCNLSIAVLGVKTFVEKLPTENIPYGTTLHAYLQRFLQNTGGEELFRHYGPKTYPNVQLIAGDFWLNVYADSLNVGSDLLAGTGLSKYVILRRMVQMAEEQANHEVDYVLIDLPPSFGALVRAAFYSADYFIVPCTSDNFNVYCVGLIGQMVPDFVRDWNTGYERFKQFNRYYEDFDNLGRPVFAGWVFNGFNTARQRRSKAEQNAGIAPKERQIVQADRAFLARLSEVVTKDLVAPMESLNYNGVASNIPKDYLIGDIEDANVLIQNSLWQSVPLGQLESVRPFTEFQHRTGWSHDQADLINILREKFVELSQNIETICV